MDERCTQTIEALEVAELDANPEKDRLKDNQHPHVDVIDALRYGFCDEVRAGSEAADFGGALRGRRRLPAARLHAASV